jgi:hypothetical protein
MVVVRILYGGRGLEPTLELIDPLWQVLGAQHPGVLNADGGGYRLDGEWVLD